jgi:hypothetical protein
MPTVDLVLLALKATGAGQYESLVAPLLKPGTAILNIQNGLGNEDHLAALFGPDRILGGLAFVCINRIAPASYTTATTAWSGGRVPRRPVARVRAGRRPVPAARVPCEVLADLRQGRWEKLVWNVPFNGLGALLDWTTDRLLAIPHGRRLVADLMAEVMAAARADGVTFAVSTEDMVRRQLRLTEPVGAYATSMQLDRRAGGRWRWRRSWANRSAGPRCWGCRCRTCGRCTTWCGWSTPRGRLGEGPYRSQPSKAPPDVARRSPPRQCGRSHGGLRSDQPQPAQSPQLLYDGLPAFDLKPCSCLHLSRQRRRLLPRAGDGLY